MLKQKPKPLSMPASSARPIATPAAAPMPSLPSAIPSPVTPAINPTVEQTTFSDPTQVDPGQTQLPDIMSMLGGQTVELPPHLAALQNVIADRAMTNKGRELRIGLGYQGYSDKEIREMEDQDALGEVATQLATKVPDSDFDDLFNQLKTQLAHPPAPAGQVALKGPSTGQLVLGGLSALLAPQFAAQSLAAPFAAQLQQRDVDQHRADVGAQDEYKRWQESVQGTQGMLEVQNRRDISADNIQARKDSAAENDKFRRWQTEQGNAIKQAQLDRLVKRDAMTNDTKRWAQDQMSQNQQVREAVAMFKAAPPEARARLAQNYRDQGLSVFQVLDDDAIEALGDLTPAEKAQTAAAALSTAKTTTENLTRQQKYLNLIKDGHVKDANVHAANVLSNLNQKRVKWFDRDTLSQIQTREKNAETARKRALDTGAGVLGRPLTISQKNSITQAITTTGNSMVQTDQLLDALNKEEGAIRANALLTPSDTHAALDDIATRRAYLENQKVRLQENATRLNDALTKIPDPVAGTPAGAIGAGTAAPPLVYTGSVKSVRYKGKDYDIAQAIRLFDEAIQVHGAKRADVIAKAKKMGITLK